MPTTLQRLHNLLKQPVLRALAVAALAVLTAAPVLLEAAEAQAQPRSSGRSGRSSASRSRSSGARSSSRSRASRSRSSSRSRTSARRTTTRRATRTRATRTHTTRTRSRTTYRRTAYYGPRAVYYGPRAYYYGPAYYGSYGYYGYYGAPVYHTTVVQRGTPADDGPRVVTGLERERGPRPFLDIGAGVAASASSDLGAPALQLSLGMREEHFGLGVGALAYWGAPADPNDPYPTSQLMEIGGISADARAFLPLGPLEPYALLGFGYYSFGEDTRGFRPTLDMGVGVNLELTDGLAVGARTTYNLYLSDARFSDPEAPSPEAFWTGLATVSLTF